MSVTLYGKASSRVAARYLQAAPLDDYYSLPSKGSPKTVGWGREKIDGFLEAATTYFEARKDSWAIIVQRDKIDTGEVDAYVARNPKLKRSKIIVVNSEAMDGDYNTSGWVVIHDIIGHSISNQQSEEIQGYVARAFHKVLPLRYQISTSPNDLEADIYAAIFFHAFPKDFADRAAEISLESDLGGVSYSAEFRKEAMEERLSSFRSAYAWIMQDVARWTSKFRPGVPRWVKPW